MQPFDEILPLLQGIADPAALLQGLFAHLPVGLAIYTVDGRCLLVNRAFREIFGSTPPPEYNILHDDVAERNGLLELIRRAFAGEIVHLPAFWYDPRELRHVRVCEGRRAAVEATCFPLFDREGAISHVAIVFADRSAEQLAREQFEAARNEAEREHAREQQTRHEAEAARRASEETVALLETLLTGSPVGFAFIDRELRFVRINEALASSTGLRPEHYIGRKVAEMLDELAPEFEPLVRRVIETSEPMVNLELCGRASKAHSEPHSWLVSFYPVQDPRGGPALGVGVVMIDISARKRSEEALRLLAEAGDVLVSSLDYEATLAALTNLAVPRLADWCAIDLTGSGGVPRRLATAHIRPSMVDHARDVLERFSYDPDAPSAHVMRTGQPELVPCVTDEDLRRAVRDPELREALRALGLRSWICVPLRAQGAVFGTLTLVMAESDRHFAPEDLMIAENLAQRAALAIDNARLYREAQEASRAKDEFLATVSHELRTPLNAILGWTTILRTRRIEPEQMERALATIERNARTQARLIEDMLDVSRIISGKLHVHVQPMDPSIVVNAAVDAVRPAADAKGVSINLSIDSHIGTVSGDPDRLQQVVWNLVSNAVKFTPRGGSVSISLAREQTSIVLRVSDTGIGIDPAFLPYVFERFRQADASTTRLHGGLGLGLAIVRHLVELHGGTVHAESEGVGRGARFTVLLPALESACVKSQSESTLHAPHESESHTLASSADLADLRVLVVDDEPDTREVLRALLVAQGAQVHCVGSAAEALAALEPFRPDVVVSDIGMPDTDGYVFMRRLRALPPARGGRTPSLALTAHASEADARHALSAGFQCYLAKPVDPPALIAAVANLGGRTRTED